MPTYTITVINDEFYTSEEITCADVVAARRHGVAATLEIATEAVAAGKPFFGAELVLEEEGKEPTKFVIAVGASMLKGPD